MDSAAAFLTLVVAFAARERRQSAVSGALRGLLAGMAAAIPVSMLRPLLPPPFPWPAAVIACVLFAVLAGGAAGRLRRQDQASLLSRLDRAFGARCLLATAHQLSVRGGRTLYREAILHDAGFLLSSADPRAVLPLPVPARMRWMPALLAAILLFALVPEDLRGLLPRRAPPDSAIASLGRDLEEYGRKLSDDAERRGLPRSLEIGRALQRLGQEMETEPMEADEAQERMEELSQELRQMQLLQPRSSSDRGGSGRTKSGTEKSGQQGSGERMDGSSEGDGGEAADGYGEEGAMSEDGRGLESAQGFLDRQKGDRRPGKSGGGNPLAGRENGEADGGGDRLGNEPGQSALSTAPGTAAVADTMGPPSEVARSSSTPEPVSPQRAEGDYAGFRLRLLPAPGEARTAKSAPDVEYGKLAESALSREDVPLELRGFVKEYFLRIGVLGE